MVRAGLQRPRTPGGDPDAQARLCAGMRPVRSVAQRAHIAARTRFFDEQVLAAIGRGVGQVVVLGAGYDDRALRFRAPGVRYFELDHPATQADKRQRLARIQADAGVPIVAPADAGAMAVGPGDAVTWAWAAADAGALTLAPADFRAGDIATVLAACGHDAGLPSLFVCEGLLVYLDLATISGLLAGLRSRAAAGSALAVSLATHPEGAASGAVLARANAARPNAAAEPWLTIRPAAAQLCLLGQAGWQVTESYDDSSFGAGPAPGHSLLIVAGPGPARPGPS
jgi:O-methyltransferase involved in polyketide biosynthesis